MAILVEEGSNPFEFACACEIFGARRRAEIGFEPYQAIVVTPRRQVTVRDGLFRIEGTADLSQLESAHTIVVPNRPDVDSATRAATLAALRRAHGRGARLIGLCTGAFTLAAAGLLDGRPATVHWQLAAEFRRRFPAVDVHDDVLYIDDGDVLTSAGSAAALDLALHVVRKDFGAEVANHVSRRLVFPGLREGGQRQFAEHPLPNTHSELAHTLDWARQRLDEPLTVADLARRAHVSAATLHRRFNQELGVTPWTWLTAERVLLARRLLEHDDAGLEAIAQRSGLGTSAHLRTLVRRHTGLSPAAYRRQFAVRRPA